jgi:transcriptional regulator with XRE-family HTH domain
MSNGNDLQYLRKERKMSLRDITDYIGIGASMFSINEHENRQIQVFSFIGN